MWFSPDCQSLCNDVHKEAEKVSIKGNIVWGYDQALVKRMRSTRVGCFLIGMRESGTFLLFFPNTLICRFSP